MPKPEYSPFKSKITTVALYPTKLAIKSLDRCDLPVSFFPVIMFNFPSKCEASMVRREESFVPPRMIGSLPSTFASFSNVGIVSFFMVDWDREGSQELLGLRLSFSTVARILQMTRLAS